MTKILILTTGPMRIPGRITGDRQGGPPDAVHISIRNPSDIDLKFQLFTDVFDDTGVGITYPDDVQLIPSNSCLTKTFFFSSIAQPGNILHFYLKGNLDEGVERLELSFVGQRTSDQMNEPTLFFRNSDLMKVELKQDPLDPPVDPLMH